MATNSAYGASARDICELYADYLQGDAGRPALALCAHAVGDAARNAIGKSLEAFGYPSNSCTFASLSPIDPSTQGGDVKLDPQALFLLVEGLDPLHVIALDAESTAALGRAYRTSFPTDAPIRVFGRPSASFADLESMLQTKEGKQQAWRVLKSLNSL